MFWCAKVGMQAFSLDGPQSGLKRVARPIFGAALLPSVCLVSQNVRGRRRRRRRVIVQGAQAPGPAPAAAKLYNAARPHPPLLPSSWWSESME